MLHASNATGLISCCTAVIGFPANMHSFDSPVHNSRYLQPVWQARRLKRWPAFCCIASKGKSSRALKQCRAQRLRLERHPCPGRSTAAAGCQGPVMRWPLTLSTPQAEGWLALRTAWIELLPGSSDSRPPSARPKAKPRVCAPRCAQELGTASSPECRRGPGPGGRARRARAGAAQCARGAGRQCGACGAGRPGRGTAAGEAGAVFRGG